jgi:hypothetical protein
VTDMCGLLLKPAWRELRETILSNLETTLWNG